MIRTGLSIATIVGLAGVAYADEQSSTTAGEGDKPKGEKPVAVVPTVKSDDKGEFTLNDVPAGEYTIRAFLRGQGQARENVTVKAGETAKVELKLAKGMGKGGAPAEKPKADVAK